MRLTTGNIRTEAWHGRSAFTALRCARLGRGGYSPLSVHMVVVGCGRVGSSLATGLTEAGHSVAIIDRKPEAFIRLPPDFAGTTIAGVGFDRDRLSEAGIESADALAAVTNGDN